ncbi:MAG: ATP-binding protein [Candidatus Euphemobacter frigidus]|nr:ATP-binding protein [Candidatus Euphemobacter frigidus]MDP8275288.1 ATP-binding protein [Candidatus Euphemobacter frigidus]
MTERFTELLVQRLDHLDNREVGEYLISLAREKGLLEDIFNSMREGLMVINPSGTIALLNHPAGRVLSLSPECVGQPFNRAILDPGLRDIIEQGFEVPEQTLVREFTVIYPQPRWVRLSRTSLRDGDGAFRGIILVLTDITRHRRSEQEINLVERLDFLSHLTAGVAHEIGNPISSLTIQVQLIERQVNRLNSTLRKELLQRISIIKEELHRLDQIVIQFLRTLRPEPLRLHEEDLVEVTEEVLALVEEELREKKITFNRRYSPEGIRGKMDKNLIKQAILNLIKNAVQAMPNGGEISIQLEQKDAYLKFSITDQGVGIAREKISRLFEPLFTTKETGSGLGLLVVYKALRQHGGYVEVTSKPGEGTTFTIWFPRRPDRAKLLPAGFPGQKS